MTRIYRSRSERKIAGLCGGIGELLDIDPTIVRLLFVVLGLATGVLPFLVGYIIGWVIIPQAPLGDAQKTA